MWRECVNAHYRSTTDGGVQMLRHMGELEVESNRIAPQLNGDSGGAKAADYAMSTDEPSVRDLPEQAETDQSRSDSVPSADKEPEPEDEEPDEPEKLSLDVIFEVLKNQRRRLVLKYLKSKDETVSLGELAEHVAAQENGKSVETISSDERKRVYVGLYQCHLPKMDDMGIVEFNRNRGLVDLTETASQLDEYLEHEEPTSTPQWYRYYGLLALAGVALAVAAAIGLGPIAAFSTAVFGAVAVSFAGLAGVHAWVDAYEDDDSENPTT